MKKINLFLLLALGLPSVSYAQTSVTIYGIIDAGVTYISNQAGSHNAVMGTGVLTPSLIGFRGTEDLGGGMRAMFTLENEFEVQNGTITGNNGLFNRQSWVGLGGPWGNLTLGNQYEFMFDQLTISRLGPILPYDSFYDLQQGPFAALGAPLGGFDFNRLAGAIRVQNAIKYYSNDMSGLTFGGMYGLGEVAGSFAQKSTSSFGAGYANGPFSVNAAYTYARQVDINNGNQGIRNWGLGGRYIATPWMFDGLYTSTKNTLTGGQVSVYEVGVTKPLTTLLTLRASYEYMKGNAPLANNKAQQVGLTLDYAFSKRTDIYSTLVYQRAGGDNGANAIILGLPGASSNGNQTALRFAMRHFF
jgi:predicted porin